MRPSEGRGGGLMGATPLQRAELVWIAPHCYTGERVSERLCCILPLTLTMWMSIMLAPENRVGAGAKMMTSGYSAVW
jgi:hypothetical protein